MSKLITVIFSLLVLSGCATTKLDPDLSNNVKNGKLATAAYISEKKIVYEELVYKVLWNEVHTQEAVFEGFWDVDKDYTEKLTAAVLSQNIDAQPAARVVSLKAYQEFEQSLEPHKQPGPQHENIGLKLNDSFRSELVQSGYEYLMLLTVPHLGASSNAISDTAPVSIPLFIYLIDVSDNKIVYTDSSIVMGFPEYEESVRELEDDGLALIREATGTRVDEALSAHAAAMFDVAESK